MIRLFPAYSRRSDLSPFAVMSYGDLSVLHNNRDLAVSPRIFEHVRQTVRLHDHVNILKQHFSLIKCPTGSIGKGSCAFTENDN